MAKKAKNGKHIGLTDKGLNYNSAWGGPFQMGGILPGMTGNMYARDGAPSNGKYAKKTKPSAKNGLQTYFQHGLDFKPKSMQKGGKALISTHQPYEDTQEWTREQYLKKQIPQDLNYVLSHFERNPKVTRVTSGTTKDTYGASWPGMVIHAVEGGMPTSKMLDPTGDVAMYDPQGQLPATQTPIIKGKTALLEQYQKGGAIDSVSNDVMLRQLYRESRFKPEVVNKKSKAKGLAQLRPIAVEELQNKHNLDINPLDPEDAILAHKKLMTVSYNKPWIEKPGTTDEVRVAKTLAAYNWGPTSLVNLLNQQKAKGVDIYKGTGWISALPQETQDYIKDSMGKNPEFEKEFKSAVKNFKFKGAYPTKQMGGPIEDDMGQWSHPGKVTKINSNKITMKGVNYPVLGVSDTGDKKLMQPNQDYQFDGNNVTEYPMGKQDKGQLKKLKQLTEFKKGGKLKKAQLGLEPLSPDGSTAIQLNTQPINPNQAFDSITGQMTPNAVNAMQVGKPGFMDKIGGIGGALNIGQGLLQGAQMIKQEKQNKKEAKKYAAISGLVNQATMNVDQPRRRYVRPEDQVFDPNQMSPSYGTGTNFLQMKKGGEIQNTYAPGTIYDDLGYEPLSESEIIKAQFGAQAGSLGSAMTSKLFGGTGQQSGAGQIGSTIGGTVGSLFGPLGNAVGGFLGGAIGGVFGAKGQKQTQKWTDEGNANMAEAAFRQGMQGQFTANMEHGGTSPQVISKFGKYNLLDLLKSGPTMDTLRAGGHLKEYTAPSEEAMQTYAMGGALKTYWGGKAEEVSVNPYLPGSGESVEFKGKSHDEGGIGITFGKAPVEVEGGEPAVKMQDGGGVDSLVVFGDMKIPSYGVSEIGDPKAKGRKFKHYVSDLNDLESRQNKIVDKGVNFINEADTNDPFDRLKMNSGEAMMIGGNMKLKDIAQKKQMASIVQNAILETAKEHGLKSDELAKGKIKKEKSNNNTAQLGGIFKKDSPFMQWVKDFQTMPTKKEKSTNKGESEATADLIERLPGVLGPGQYPKRQYPLPQDSNFGKPVLEETLPMEGYKKGVVNNTMYEVDPYAYKADNSFGQYWYNNADYNKVNMLTKPETEREILQSSTVPIKNTMKTATSILPPADLSKLKAEIELPTLDSFKKMVAENSSEIEGLRPTSEIMQTKSKKDGLGVLDYLNAYLPYLRPTNQKGLDPNQLMGEMFALSTNNLEPVQAQKYNPLLETPTRLSYQDALNANQADFNALRKTVGNNPEALAALAGQKYGANAAVIAEQERQNQDRYMGAYNRNRGVLNDATLKNLAILDQQYTRQATAKSNTKAVAQSALSSISDKIAKNKLENRTLGIYENLYNYRFGPQGRAWNMNAPAQFNTEGMYPQENEDNVTRIEEKTSWDAKNLFNGRTRKVTKKSSNGSIVKSLK